LKYNGTIQKYYFLKIGREDRGKIAAVFARRPSGLADVLPHQSGHDCARLGAHQDPEDVGPTRLQEDLRRDEAADSRYIANLQLKLLFSCHNFMYTQVLFFINDYFDEHSTIS